MNTNRSEIYDYIYQVSPKYGISPMRLCTVCPLLNRIKFDNALDVGAGRGMIVEYIRRLYKVPVIGIDISEVAINSVPHLAKDGTMRHGSINNIQFPNRSFDLVICTDVLEHQATDKVADCIRELTCVSRKHVLIEVDLGDCQEDKLLVGTKWEGTQLHQTKKDATWWISMIERCGLRVNEFHNPYPSKAIFICEKKRGIFARILKKLWKRKD